jgi:phosphoglucomutase
MAPHPLAGKPAPADLLVDVPALLAAYHDIHPDPAVPGQRVAFGTSGHRGTSTDGSFNEDHVAAISQALAEYRAAQGFRGPVFIGIDTHALSEPALTTALEVLAANEVISMVAAGDNYTPTPLVSHAILTFNRARPAALADGVVITPSHNPPTDGGFKYNPPSGGPADTTATKIIQDRANELLRAGLRGVKRMTVTRGRAEGYIREYNFITPYVEDLTNVLDMQAIAASGLRFGADPLGGSSLPLWEPIKALYGLNLTVVNDRMDPTFSFMSLDHDGKIRMDCSSSYAMAGLIGLKDDFDVAWGNDPDADRHGIVTSHGLMNPNHFLAVAVLYLFQHRAAWRPDAGIGKTLVSSSIIDRIAHHLKRPLVETPVGFKWFVDGLLEGSLGFGGEESAGAAFLRADGTAWTTDKDGIIMDLLAAEVTAVTGRNPAEHYHAIEAMFGSPVYERVDAPANAAQKKVLANLSAELITATDLAGDPIVAVQTRASGNNAPIGGLKVATQEGWFAARPSGTEDVYKIYAESFRGRSHLRQLQEEAQAMVSGAFNAAGAA